MFINVACWPEYVIRAIAIDAWTDRDRNLARSRSAEVSEQTERERSVQASDRDRLNGCDSRIAAATRL